MSPSCPRATSPKSARSSTTASTCPSVISRSGMATIFKAKDLNSGEVVAVKVPFMQFESDPAFYSRFQREEAIGKQLHHPYILHVLPIEEERAGRTSPWSISEGRRCARCCGAWSGCRCPHALDIAGRVCEALDYLHGQNIIHRDMKPENIMLCDDGSIRIMDFGIAKAAGLRRLTFTGFSAAMGTPDYMAPEQVKGKRGDARTDLYSLGAMLYEMVTGQPPFEGTNPYAIMNARLVSDPIAPRQINPEIPPQVEEIILHALEQQPYNRYPSAKAMKAELDAPETVQVTGRSERLRPPVAWQGRWHTVRMVLLPVLLAVAVFLILLLFFGRRGDGKDRTSGQSIPVRVPERSAGRENPEDDLLRRFRWERQWRRWCRRVAT